MKTILTIIAIVILTSCGAEQPKELELKDSCLAKKDTLKTDSITVVKDTLKN